MACQVLRSNLRSETMAICSVYDVYDVYAVGYSAA